MRRTMPYGTSLQTCLGGLIGRFQNQDCHSTEENSRLSPGLVCVLRIVPEASSITECADRQAESRQGGTALLTFFTVLFRSRYTRSIGNLMPKVCTDSQGMIHRPSPAERLPRPSRPFLRAAP